MDSKSAGPRVPESAAWWVEKTVESRADWTAVLTVVMWAVQSVVQTAVPSAAQWGTPWVGGKVVLTAE